MNAVPDSTLNESLRHLQAVYNQSALFDALDDLDKADDCDGYWTAAAKVIAKARTLRAGLLTDKVKGST